MDAVGNLQVLSLWDFIWIHRVLPHQLEASAVIPLLQTPPYLTCMEPGISALKRRFAKEPIRTGEEAAKAQQELDRVVKDLVSMPQLLESG